MSPHRKETNLQNEPVKFYKVVALSFLFLTLLLLGIIVFMSSKRATITILTKSKPIEAKINIEVNSANPDTGFIEFATTTLTKKFKPSASKEEETVAGGTVILINDSNSGQSLIATTRLLNPEGVLFRLKKGVVVPAKGSIEAEVYADKPGKASEIGPSTFVIPGLNESKQKEIYAKSTATMLGGIKQLGVVGEEDIKEAESEINAEIKKMGEEKLAALHPELKAVYTVLNSKSKSDKEIGVETTEFSLTGESLVVGIFYNQNKAIEAIKEELSKKVVGEIDVLSDKAIELVSVLENFNLETGLANLKVASSGLVELNPESSQLQKIIFFGKTKDEIRRYLLSLDHVSGVEIKFSPAWMNTVPHVAEHVNVVVKKVE